MPSVTLSSDDVARLEATLYSLLSPLEFPNFDAWRREACSNVQDLLRADKVAMLLPGVPGELAITTGWDASKCQEDYFQHYWQVDMTFRYSRKMLELGVYHRDMIADARTLANDEAFNDWAKPNGLMDCIGTSIDLGSRFPFALIHCYHDRDGHRPFSERGLALLRLLRPAFHAGARTARQFGLGAEAVRMTMDGLKVGVAFFDSAGTLVHQNPALSALLASDPEHARIGSEIRSLAVALASLQTAPRKSPRELPPRSLVSRLATAAAEYRFHGSLFSVERASARPATMVWLERLTPEWPRPDALCARFGLTAKEAQVALQLARGRGNTEIAKTLSISPHTARHHTESVLRKLGVQSRGQVAAKILA